MSHRKVRSTDTVLVASEYLLQHRVEESLLKPCFFNISHKQDVASGTVASGTKCMQVPGSTSDVSHTCLFGVLDIGMWYRYFLASPKAIKSLPADESRTTTAAAGFSRGVKLATVAMPRTRY